MIQIRPLEARDRQTWAVLRAKLWPEAGAEDLARETEAYLRGDRRIAEVVLVAATDSRLVGFVELSFRSYAEGCATDRVPYLEAWYVEPDVRRRGIGRRLIDAAAAWARANGGTELGSDADLGNQVSQVAHGALGFEETGRIVTFRKALAP
jgi:aminoglycoside 6'-N-acetyltransferase I